MTSALKIASTANYVIEKNVPLAGRKGNASVHPFPHMEIGDSFVVGIEELARVRSAATSWGRFHSKRFSGRKVDAATGRVWRVS